MALTILEVRSSPLCSRLAPPVFASPDGIHAGRFSPANTHQQGSMSSTFRGSRGRAPIRFPLHGFHLAYAPADLDTREAHFRNRTPHYTMPCKRCLPRSLAGASLNNDAYMFPQCMSLATRILPRAHRCGAIYYGDTLTN